MMDRLSPADVARIRMAGGPRRPRVHIESDGTPRNTVVYDAAGQRIQAPISRIEWSIAPDQLATARVTFLDVSLHVAGGMVAEKNAGRL